MNEDEVVQTIKQLLENNDIQLEYATEEQEATSLSASGLSSLAWLRLMIDLENTFQIELDLQQSESYSAPTLQQLVQYVASEIGKQ